MNIEVHIERLILDGLPVEAWQGEHVRAAVEAELARLLAQGGVARELQSGGAMPSLRADSIQLPATSQPAQLGRQIGQTVYGGFGQTPSSDLDTIGGDKNASQP